MPSRTELKGNDYETVVFNKKPSSNSHKPSTKEPDTSKIKTKADQKKNSHLHGAGMNMRKLDMETEELKHEKVSLELSKAIAQGRLNKKMSQADLDKTLNLPKGTINSYEAKTAIPNRALLSKIERILNVKLPR